MEQNCNFFEILLQGARSHLFTETLFCMVYGLDVGVIFHLLCNKLHTGIQNWSMSCNNLVEGEMLAGWEQHGSEGIIISYKDETVPESIIK